MGYRTYAIPSVTLVALKIDCIRNLGLNILMRYTLVQATFSVLAASIAPILRAWSDSAQILKLISKRQFAPICRLNDHRFLLGYRTTQLSHGLDGRSAIHHCQSSHRCLVTIIHLVSGVS